MPSAEDYRVAGLYDPDDPAQSGRLELLAWLDELGFGIERVQELVIAGAVSGIASDYRMVPGERVDRATAIERSGLGPELFDAYSTAFGFVRIQGAPEGEIGYTQDELESLAAFGALAAVFSLEESMALIRVIASSLARIADASVSLFLTDVEAPRLGAGSSELELGKAVYEVVGLLDGFAAGLDPILRRQMLQAVERSRRSFIDDPTRSLSRYAVGFVDLVGFTPLSATMSSLELAKFVAHFEGRAHDVVTATGARVVKLIGDEVMFVSPDPDAACRAARALIGAFPEVGDGVLPRGGLAYGDVLPRSGDYYGPVVNIASRLVGEAVPLELLVTVELAEAAPEWEFQPAGRRMLRGFTTPIPVRSFDVAGSRA